MQRWQSPRLGIASPLKAAWAPLRITATRQRLIMRRKELQVSHKSGFNLAARPVSVLAPG